MTMAERAILQEWKEIAATQRLVISSLGLLIKQLTDIPPESVELAVGEGDTDDSA